jgi:hypothetical protein
MDPNLIPLLKQLRLTRLLANWDNLLSAAQQGHDSHERLLREILEAECQANNDNARLLRRQRANIPELFSIETYPWL